MNNNIIDVNEADFESKVLEASSNKLVIVDFWAPWCAPCKQLTPILEKIISASPEKILLAKINIDENQQIASQLRIQSIPAVFAFKDQEVVNAFQGVIQETEIIKFLEKCLGEKLQNNFQDFYTKIQNLFNDKKFSETKDLLESFIFENSKETKGICMYLESLIALDEIDTTNDFLESLDDEMLNKDRIKKIIKRINLIKQSGKGPSLEALNKELANSPENLDIIFKIADTHFANNEFDNSFETLLKHYPKNKEKIKSKILNFFDVLGFEHQSTILYRKKLSSIIFS